MLLIETKVPHKRFKKDHDANGINDEVEIVPFTSVSGSNELIANKNDRLSMLSSCSKTLEKSSRTKPTIKKNAGYKKINKFSLSTSLNKVIKIKTNMVKKLKSQTPDISIFLTQLQRIKK